MSIPCTFNEYAQLLPIAVRIFCRRGFSAVSGNDIPSKTKDSY